MYQMGKRINRISANQFNFPHPEPEFNFPHPEPEHNQNQHQEVSPLMELETFAWLKIQPATLHKTTTKNQNA